MHFDTKLEERHTALRDIVGAVRILIDNLDEAIDEAETLNRWGHNEDAARATQKAELIAEGLSEKLADAAKTEVLIKVYSQKGADILRKAAGEPLARTHSGRGRWEAIVDRAKQRAVESQLANLNLRFDTK